MKKEYDVHNYTTHNRLGSFLNITDAGIGPRSDGVKIWYLGPDDNIHFEYQEAIYLKEVKDYG